MAWLAAHWSEITTIFNTLGLLIVGLAKKKDS